MQPPTRFQVFHFAKRILPETHNAEVWAVKTVYVGNLNVKTTEEELRKAFEPFGVVELVTMPRDMATGRVRGFAFVEMQDETAAADAIRALNGSQLGDRTVVVNEARPRPRSTEPRGDGERRFGRG